MGHGTSKHIEDEKQRKGIRDKIRELEEILAMEKRAVDEGVLIPEIADARARAEESMLPLQDSQDDIRRLFEVGDYNMDAWLELSNRYYHQLQSLDKARACITEIETEAFHEKERRRESVHELEREIDRQRACLS
jgi:hypothetical protein